MGSKERRRGLVIITIPRNTLETTIFRDPRERPLERCQDDQYRQLYITSFHPQPTPVFAWAELLSVVDEDRLRRLYVAAVSLMPNPTEKRGLTGDQMLAVTAKIENYLRCPQPLPEMDD
jgi:hypothetical protein